MADERIVIVDDHPLFRGALKQALSATLDGVSIEEAGSLEQLLGHLGERVGVDLVLLDLSMPGVEGLSGLLLLKAQYPEIPVAIVSAIEDPVIVRRSLECGASGYIPKSLSVEEIRKAVSSVLDGEIWTPPDMVLQGSSNPALSDLTRRLSTLTPQQMRVLMMLREGLLNKQIAYKLSVSEATIKAHVSAILQKLDVDSRTQAVIAIAKIAAPDLPDMTSGNPDGPN